MLKVKSNQHGITFFLKICLNLNFQQLFQDSACAFLKTTYAVMFPATWCISWHHRFSKYCNFVFGAKKWLITVELG